MKFLLAAALLLASTAAPVPARDAAFTRHDAGACASRDVLASIVRRFSAFAPVTLKTDLAIVEIRDMHVRGFNLRDRHHLVGRDYCGGTALTSDGVVRPIWYLIERDFAFASLGSGVEFCLGGLDPTYVYGNDCASLK